MEVGLDHYEALHACINSGNTEAAQMLLERGMDFGQYIEWTKANSQNRPIQNNAAFDTMCESWNQDLDKSGSELQQPGITQMGGI
jgi:hypothetical protein